MYFSSSSQSFSQLFLCVDPQCNGEITARRAREFILNSRQWFVMSRETPFFMLLEKVDKVCSLSMRNYLYNASVKCHY
jgi:hypothetical protein